MTYQEATNYAANGKTLLLPGWKGYFKWDYGKEELLFKNGDYILNLELLIKDFHLNNREDWYYII